MMMMNENCYNFILSIYLYKDLSFYVNKVFIMPHIDINFISSLEEDYKSYSNFIETGTCFGHTIFRVEPYFEKLYTIEIKKELYESTKSRYSGNKINFIHGDSSIELSKLLPNIEGKSILFLDGHWSAGQTGKGEKDCPLYEELEQIVQYHNEEAILIIDDVRMFGKGPNKGTDICNWEDINMENVLNLVKVRMTKKYFLPSFVDKDDRLIIHISKK